MATVVVHGTLLAAAAPYKDWWWNSYRPGGFLHALTRGMTDACGGHDVWRIGGRHVSDIPELNGTAQRHRLAQHRGHFLWTGANMGVTRDAAASGLVDYLTVMHAISPREPIRLVGHSHGGNVIKLATASRKLPATLPLGQAVFLGVPHFMGVDGRTFTYRLDPRRFSGVLNLYSERDSVQRTIAEKIFGPPGARMSDWMPVKAHHVDRDPRAAAVYRNCEVPTLEAGMDAHAAMHGAAVGYLVGYWLGGRETLQAILDRLRPRLFPVRRGDHGTSSAG
jgi:hypothetical protein